MRLDGKNLRTLTRDKSRDIPETNRHNTNVCRRAGVKTMYVSHLGKRCRWEHLHSLTAFIHGCIFPCAYWQMFCEPHILCKPHTEEKTSQSFCCRILTPPIQFVLLTPVMAPYYTFIQSRRTLELEIFVVLLCYASHGGYRISTDAEGCTVTMKHWIQISLPFWSQVFTN